MFYIEEIWKPVVGFEKYYKVSNLGNIFSIRSKRLLIVKPKYTGYMDIELNIYGKVYYKRVHRLVAEAFIPNPHHKEQVNHLDGNKLNNKVSNLEWATQSENMIHAYATGLEIAVPRNVKHRLYCDNDSILFDTVKKLSEDSGLTKDKIKYLKRTNLEISTGKYKGYKIETIK